MIRTLARATLLAVAATLLVPVSASAHPFFREREAPASSLATLTLDLVHGCDAEDGGDAHGDEDLGHPTTAVAMELPHAVTYVDPADADGWIVDVEVDDGRLAVVTWSDAGGAEPAPRFELDLVVEGVEGDEVYFRVVQRCDDAVYRWIGTPDDPADDPAVRLTLAAPDPDRSPPAPEPDVPATEEASEDPGVLEPTGPASAPETSDDPTDEPTGAAAVGPEGTGPAVEWPLAVAVAGALLVVAIGAGVALRRRGGLDA